MIDKILQDMMEAARELEWRKFLAPADGPGNWAQQFALKHGFDLDAGDKLFLPVPVLPSEQWPEPLPEGVEVSTFVDRPYLVKMSAAMDFCAGTVWAHDKIGVPR